MRRSLTAALTVAGGLLAASAAWTLYQRVTTETVPYTVLARVGDAELRRYPETVSAETAAPSERDAFRRLFEYIDGANAGESDLPMTAPVEVGGKGTSVAMTAPVEVDADDEGVRMVFYLPPEYDLESAPRPTDDRVDLAGVPERTLAVRRFSCRPTDSRVDRETDRLLETLADADVATAGDPLFMGYDAPGVLPFLRRNEVAVEVGT